jgi:NTP pyrophosphatase (non-canonical NTP hydrolase)
MNGRPMTEGDLALKAMTRLLIERAGGLDAAAAATRVGRSQLANYYSPHHDQFAPVDVVARLEDIAEEPMLTEELLRRRGLVASKPQGSASASIHTGLAALAGEMCELHRAYAEGLADGQLCDKDRAAMERELQDVMRQAGNLLADLHARLATAAVTPLPLRRA